MLNSQPITKSDLDLVLTTQIAVGWAGERGEEPRLGWWRCDLASEFGGQDLLKRMLPHTWQWAILQGVREAARRHDAAKRAQDHNPDRLVSLYSLGAELDERLEERFLELKASGKLPQQALPGLKEVISDTWNQSHFSSWIEGHGESGHTSVPVGRKLKGDMPTATDRLVRSLVSALLPLGSEYSLPHYRRSV